jgi:endonuclease/exonuclease/phosphatase (EEP) superfamily protein YafD
LFHQNPSIAVLGSKASELNASSINFLCWNIKKGMRPNWREDLLDLADGKDLVIIQEAVLHSDLTEAFDKSAHCTFAKGYKTKKHTTGVMTISKHEPVRRHQLTCWEPWLATPKCTNITEYALSDTEETLIVVNIHAINFTLGVKQFRKQIDKVRKELAKHKGPIILSGDFNTWRKKRMKILDTLAIEHGLEALTFQEDHRKTVFGQMLDHIYVRSLTPESTDTYNVSSSDHNPLSAELSF